MKFNKRSLLKNGKELILRSGSGRDAEALLNIYMQTHMETDFLLSYPDESTYTVAQEAAFLKTMAEQTNEVELLAEVDGTVIGCASVNRVGGHYKEQHRAELGISILKDYWHLGIGRALTLAGIECAKTAGYAQLELTVVAENKNALALYKNVGFTEFGRNPKGFCSRLTGYQETVHMRLEL